MPRYADLGERIIANSVLSETQHYNGTPCWIWIGCRNNYGYGKIDLTWKSGPRKGTKRVALAHRIALMFFTGRKLTARSVAKHLCNTRACVNPGHLLGGTQKSNVRQCVREGRHKTPFRKEQLCILSL